MAVTQQRGRVSAETDGKLPKRLSLDLPMLSIEVRRPEVRLPHVGMPHLGMPRISKQEMGHYVDVARTFIPPPERIAYYGALGALAVFGVVDWPVAAAIGAGTIIAQRGRRAPSASIWQRGTQQPAPTPTPAQQATTSTRRRTATTSGTAAGRKTATTADTTAGRKTATTADTTAGRKTATTSGTTAGRRKSATQSR
ncbi:hypothetical protein [Nonomuraea sp. NPDC049480]|uniref:hypothetical protein n=1 Tax=Nonomuraea sp. NPDC049480 TaxID=3364353 RepID=UPI0037915112